MRQIALVGQTLLVIEASRPLSDTSHSVGLLWTSYQLVAETSTWQHNTHDIHAPGGIRTHNLSRRAAADRRLSAATVLSACSIKKDY
jgi:hypothetical protein